MPASPPDLAVLERAYQACVAGAHAPHVATANGAYLMQIQPGLVLIPDALYLVTREGIQRFDGEEG